MALTDQQYQDLIVAQVGDDASGTLAAQIAVLWAQYAGEPEPLRYLYAKRGAIEVMQAVARKLASFKALDGASVDLGQLFRHLEAMYRQVQEQIAEAEQTGVVPQLDQLTVTAPIDAPNALWPDANDPLYRGQPYPPPPSRPGRWP